MGEALITRRGGVGGNVEMLPRSSFTISGARVKSISGLNFTNHTYVVSIGGIDKNTYGVTDVYVIENGVITQKRFGLAFTYGADASNEAYKTFGMFVDVENGTITVTENTGRTYIQATTVIAIS